jgi:hypothetical protein
MYGAVEVSVHAVLIFIRLLVSDQLEASACLPSVSIVTDAG